MAMTMIITMFGIMLATSISLYEVLRCSRPFGWFIRIIDKSFLFQMAFHFAIAFVIRSISGEGMTAGGANLASTAVFPLYCFIRNAINGNYRMLNGGWRTK
jgi:hypothetical protein